MRKMNKTKWNLSNFTPYNMGYYVILLSESDWHCLDINNFDNYLVGTDELFRESNTLITYQTADLIQFIKGNSKVHKLPDIVDLECFDKQMSQEGKEFRDYTQWRAINFLRHHNAIDVDFQFDGNIKIYLELLASLFNSLLEKDSLETARFNNIEMPINRIIYERQLKGVCIDLDIAKSKCVELEENIYRIKNILQIEHYIFSPDQEACQLDYLKSNGYNLIQSPIYSFKIKRHEDKVCKLFYELLRDMQDLESFMFMLSHWGGDKRTFPTYKGFGTITSRITLRQPSLQNLKRINREVIIADVAKKLLYIDYSQFEAGLLASLSDDEKLIDLYNQDIYDDLAEKVFKNKSMRSDAKILFYRYMYGDDTLSKSAKLYFGQFPKLIAYRKSIEKAADNEKRIGTINGNFRCVLEDKSRWALSHVIQSTASLIYKNALIRVRRELPEAEFLVPMHDATLYQLDIHRFEELTEKIKTIYEAEFKKCCPKLNVATKTSMIFG